MKSEKKTEIKVGVTVFTAIIIFFMVYGWANNFNPSSNKSLHVKFPTVAGLEIGDLVSVNGVRKGLVENISSKDNNAFVELIFTEDIDLREDATFSIMMLDLMGGKKVEINSGESNNLLKFDDIQNGKFSGDISTAMATLSSVESDLVDVIGELKTSLKSANNILGNSEFSDNINSTLKQFAVLSRNMNELVSDNKVVIKQTLENAKELTDKTNSLIDNNSAQISTVLANLDSTLTSSNILVQKLTKLSNDVINSENNLGKLLNNEELLDDLQISIKQIKELTEIINQQLKSGGLEVKADVDLF